MARLSYVCATMLAMSGLIVSTRRTSGAIQAQRAAGEVSRLRRGLYSVNPDELAQVMAATVRLDAVASHETAAEIWGLPALGRSPLLHVTRARRCQGTARYDGVTVHHARLSPEHVVVVRGVPVTTAARTVADLSRRRAFRAGVVTADAALRAGHCTPQELAEVAAECRGWPGVSRARRVAAFADSRAASPLESISRVAFHDYGLPRPALQALIGGFDEADFLWGDYRVIGEADGLDKYTSPEVLRREKLREEGFAQLGFSVFRWTWPDVYRRPDAVAHRALVVLSRRGYRP